MRENPCLFCKRLVHEDEMFEHLDQAHDIRSTR